MDHNKLENSPRDGNTRPPYMPPEKPVYADQEATVRIRHGTIDWFKTEKGEVKAVYCHPECLTYMQSTSCEDRKSTRLNSSHSP